MSLLDPYPRIEEISRLTYGFYVLLEQYAYNIKSKYVKVTLGYNMQLPSGIEVECTLGSAIPLYDNMGNLLPKRLIYYHIEKQVREYADRYENSVIKGLFIHIYYIHEENQTSLFSPIPGLEDSLLFDIRQVLSCSMTNRDLPPVQSLQFKEGRVPKYITALKASDREECRSFIVADIETVMLNKIHVPYAAGYLVVNPGDDLTSIPIPIKTFFSEDHIFYSDKFEKRSERMLELFLYDLEQYVKSNRDVRTVYFHNFSRFDGIFILRHYVNQGDKYKIIVLLRNAKLYELKIRRKNLSSENYTFILRFRDSLTLLPSPLALLSKALCPELGSKGELAHKDLRVDNLQVHKEEIMKYLRQDILLLGGVMKKVQEINWSHYSIDIENVMTVSSLVMTIFRMKYLNDKLFQISIPTRNQDAFIRRGYYGGHVDVYKPCGLNLHYYDVNSLYPYVMQKYPMPSGVPVWHNSLKGCDLDTLFGFVEAYVVCPTTIEHPFLPYKEDDTLIFPTGRFVGVYYTEELKFARNLGYEIIPLLFPKAARKPDYKLE